MMFSKLSPLWYLAAASPLVANVAAIVNHGLSHDQLALIRQRLRDGAHASWELGTAAQAFLEIDEPDVSVFGASPFPPPRQLAANSSVIAIAEGIINSRSQYAKTLMEDGAAGDPMSNGVSVLVANFSCPWDDRYLPAFQAQLSFIENEVPRTEDGAISHRTDDLQLWADSGYMVAPVLAYWGALQTDLDSQRHYLNAAVEQLRLYRQYLRDPADNTYHHVVLGAWSDMGKWATGQGWMAAGMLRVHQTISKSAVRDEFGWAMDELVGWVEEIVEGTWNYQQEDGSLRNYLDQPGSFREMSSTALMAAVTYRLAVLCDATSHVPHADRAFELVKNMIDPEGWLLEPVDPYQFSVSSQHSPEGQAFVLMLQAAFRDYEQFQKGVGNSLAKVFNALADAALAQ